MTPYADTVFSILTLQNLDFDNKKNFSFFPGQKEFYLIQSKSIRKIPSGSKFHEYLYFPCSFFNITHKHYYKLVRGNGSLQFIRSLKHATNMSLILRC